MKNIAVILRGHKRTWEYNHKNVFKFYDEIAENVEYYFVTWQFPDFHTKKIIESFSDNNKKLIKFLTLEPASAFYTSWLGPSWLNHNIIPFKKQRELEITYDAVFDTRPDILYKTIPGVKIFKPEQNTLYVTQYQLHVGPDNKRHVGIEDHFLMSTSEVHDKINLRHAYRDDIGCQSKILQLATSFNIHTARINWVQESIVRPNVFEEIPNSDNYFKSNHRLSSENWMHLPLERKLEILRKYDIRQEDYTTASILAKL